jgi:hypothetical protein
LPAIDAALMLSNAQVHRLFWPIELGPRFQVVERHLDGQAARRGARRCVVGTPQEGSEALAADRPSLTMVINYDVSKSGADKWCGIAWRRSAAGLDP